MALVDNNISPIQVQKELGLSYPIKDFSGNFLYPLINKWSFYRPGKLQINNDLLIELVQPTPNWPTEGFPFGDFRRYNHNAIEPWIIAYDRTYVEGASTVNVEIDFRSERFNIKEVVPNIDPYVQVNYYSSASDRDNRINIKGYTRELVELVSETPPVGHTNNQTQATLGIQLIEDSIPLSYLSATPNGTVYIELFICDSTGVALLYFANGKDEINVTRQAIPKIPLETYSVVTPDSPYSFYSIVLMDGGFTTDIRSGGDYLAQVGTGNISVYWCVVGYNNNDGKVYRLGASSFSGRLKIGSNTYALSESSVDSGFNNQISTSNMLGSNDTWAYDDIGYLEIVSISDLTEGAEIPELSGV